MSNLQLRHLIPLRVAAAVAVGLLLVLVVLRAVGVSLSWIAIVSVAAGIAAVAYVVAYRATELAVNRRLDQAIEMLARIRQRDFGSLDLIAPSGSVDTAGLNKLDQLEDAILKTGQTLRQEIENLRTIESYRKDFLGNVSHELKTPIFSIRGFAETLLDGALDRPEVREEFTRKMLHNADRLANLVSDLSEISRLETGELKIRYSTFQIADLVADVLESIEAVATAKNIDLVQTPTGKLPPVDGDEPRLRQVLTNLVDNGIKYTNDGGWVRVACTLEDDSIRVTVADNGIGIEAKHLQRVTERFYRVDASRSRAQGGTGLGLAIVKHILSAHERPLNIVSKPGEGSSFSFTLRVGTTSPAVR